MHKKKIQTLIAAGLLSVGVIGGTLAWFTSEDSVTNIFNTGSVTDREDGLDAGIDVEEDFPGAEMDEETGDMVYQGSVTPSQTLKKEVWVENTANYDQIVRARVVKNFIDPSTENVVTHYYTGEDGSIKYGIGEEEGSQLLNLSYIVLAENLNGNTNAPSGWTVQLNGKADTTAEIETNWYYYNNRVTPHTSENHTNGTCKTTDLLKTVTLSNNAGDEYKNLRFDVKVEAQSIQATNGAINDSSIWEDVPESIKGLNISTSTNN